MNTDATLSQRLKRPQVGQAARSASGDAAFLLGGELQCGAAASPRFNLTVQPPTGPETSHFIGGCANGANTPAPQDPGEWSRHRVVFTSAQSFPPVAPGSRLKSLALLYDEGTDVPTTEDPRGVGLAVVDNIFVDGRFIRSGWGIAPSDHGHRGDPGDRNDHRPRGRDSDD